METQPVPDPAQTAIAETLRAAMAERGLSQRALERQAGLPGGTVSRVLSGEQSVALDTATKLAAALEISVDRLLGRSASAAETGPIRLLALDWLVPSSLNPRRTFDAEALQQLADSIAADGLLQNLVVRPLPAHLPVGDSGMFQVIAGERRYRALCLLRDALLWNADAPVIPCRVVEADDVEVRAIALLENLQRADLSPLEEAQAFDALRRLDAERWTTAAIAERIHRSQRFVQQRLALLNLDDPARDALAEGRIGIEQARSLSSEPPERQRELLDEQPQDKAKRKTPEPAPDEDAEAERARQREDEAAFYRQLQDAMAGGTLVDLLAAFMIAEIVANDGVPEQAARLLGFETPPDDSEEGAIHAIWRNLAGQLAERLAQGASIFLVEALRAAQEQPLLAELADHYGVPVPQHWARGGAEEQGSEA
jgi:ParB/RepB/Spo0J family partition protein